MHYLFDVVFAINQQSVGLCLAILFRWGSIKTQTTADGTMTNTSTNTCKNKKVKKQNLVITQLHSLIKLLQDTLKCDHPGTVHGSEILMNVKTALLIIVTLFSQCAQTTYTNISVKMMGCLTSITALNSRWLLHVTGLNAKALVKIGATKRFFWCLRRHIVFLFTGYLQMRPFVHCCNLRACFWDGIWFSSVTTVANYVDPAANLHRVFWTSWWGGQSNQ